MAGQIGNALQFPGLYGDFIMLVAQLGLNRQGARSLLGTGTWTTP